MPPRYLHTNLVARDWRRLAAFYESVFGCTRLAPERDLSGPAMVRGTGVPDAHIRGAHLRLPGVGADGPTLEVFEYDACVDVGPPPANRVGFGHIAFAVDDVQAAHATALAAGATPVGTIESVEVPGGGTITWTYVRDPEGNIVELQEQRRSPSS